MDKRNFRLYSRHELNRQNRGGQDLLVADTKTTLFGLSRGGWDLEKRYYFTPQTMIPVWLHSSGLLGQDKEIKVPIGQLSNYKPSRPLNNTV